MQVGFGPTINTGYPCFGMFELAWGMVSSILGSAIDHWRARELSFVNAGPNLQIHGHIGPVCTQYKQR